MRGFLLDRLYDAVVLLAAVCFLPVGLIRWMREPGVRERFGERLGHYPEALRRRLAGAPAPIWVHAVSVGEVTAILPLVRALAGAPGAGGEAVEAGTGEGSVPVVLSTVTVTGNRTARDRAPEGTVVTYLPVDLRWVVRRAVRTLRPRLFVSTESEIWPALIGELDRAGVPVSMANGRVSERSARRFRAAGWFFRPVLARIALYAVQSERFRERLTWMGAPAGRVQVLGNLKYDLDVEPPDEGRRDALRARLGLAPGRAVVVAGSTHEGEESALLDAIATLGGAAPPALVLAPRHPVRFEAVARLLAERALRVRRWSEGEGPDAPGSERGGAPGVDVHLLDTIGELGRVYGVGSVAFVGGTLAPIGGHNLLEPAAHGVPVVFGPHTESCQDVAEDLLEAGAGIQIGSADELAGALARLLEPAGPGPTMGRAGLALIAAHRGAAERTAAALRGLLQGGTGGGG